MQAKCASKYLCRLQSNSIKGRTNAKYKFKTSKKIYQLTATTQP